MSLARSWSQGVRRLTQLAAATFVVYAAAGGTWRNYKLAHNNRRLVELMEGELFGWLYGLNNDLLALFGEPYEVSFSVLGMPWSATVGGVQTLDPLLAAGHVASTGGVSPSLLWPALLPLVLAAVLGKVFCSHLCPMRLLFEVGQAVRRGLVRLGVPLPAWRPSARLGGFVLVGALVASATSGMAIWLLVLPYVALSAGVFLLVSTQALSFLLGLSAALLLVDLLVAPGAICHNACPTGFLLEQVGRFSLWRLKRSEVGACPASCRVCEDVCPYALSPRTSQHQPACHNCGVCAAVCPSSLLGRELAVPVRRRSLPVVAAVVAWAAFTATPAQAHHNKGLPHYGYFENYPQVPTEEHVVIRAGWELGATIFNFQGLERRSADTPNDVKIYLYLFDLKADGNYRGPLEVQILREGEVVSSFVRDAVDEEAVYATRETLPASGSYELVVLPRERPGVRVALPFDVDLASDRVDVLLLAALGAPVLLVFLLALFGRSRFRGQRRRGASGARVLTTALLGLAVAGAAVASPAAVDGPGVPERVAVVEPGGLPASSGRASADAAAEAGSPVAPAAPPPCETHGAGTMRHYADDEGGSVMVMGGIPRGLFLGGIGLVIFLSFVAVELFGRSDPKRWRLNLIKNRRVYAVVRSRWFQAVPQLVAVVVLGLLTYAGLFGSRVANITPVAVWTLWWAGLIFAVALVGPAFCWACPWDGLANLASRLRVAARVEPLGLRLPFPRALANLYPAIALFVVLTWLELGFGVTTNPRSTAYLGLGMAALAATTALLFDGKRFCAHFCPVGRISGIYANFSPVEVRARNPKTCQVCKTEDCLNGNARGYPCPTGISLKVVDDSTYCTLCTECVKSCDKQNVAFNLRPFGEGLDAPRRGRLDEAWLALSLLALTLFHGLSMTPAWENFQPGGASLLKWLSLGFGLSKVTAFTVGMAGAVAVPLALYGLSSVVGAWWAGGAPRARDLFVEYAWSLLPVALFYHLAHNAMHLLNEAGEIVPLLSDPLGSGADWLGTRGSHPGPLVGETALAYLQVGLILVGHIFGVLVAHRASRRLYAKQGPAVKSLLPLLGVMILVSVAGLGLMHLDMNMRVGRM